MPHREGKWTYLAISNVKEMNNKKGSFESTPAQKDNHGPVVVKDTFYFAYTDGTPHITFGTTCYGWEHQGDSLGDATIKKLSKAYFNKI